MNSRPILYNRLFPKREGVDTNDLIIDNDAVSYITNPFDSQKITALICKIMAKYNKSPKEVIIVDATACVGGDTITFCSTFGIVIPIELEKFRFDYLKHNLQVYNIHNAYPILGNSLEIIPDLETEVNCIFLDIPWGGSSYKLHQKLELTFGGYELNDIVKMLFNKKKSIKLIVWKLPKNYDHDSFKRKLGNGYGFIMYTFLRKIDIIMIVRQAE